MLPAIINEYEHGEDFCQVENICIHIFVAKNYIENNWNPNRIVEKIKLLMDDEVKIELIDLGDEYSKFNKDYNAIKQLERIKEKNETK